MYETYRSTHRVKWHPDDQELAEQAMQEVVDRFDEWRGSRYTLKQETAHAVRDRYRELHIAEYVEDSPYHEGE